MGLGADRYYFRYRFTVRVPGFPFPMEREVEYCSPCAPAIQTRMAYALDVRPLSPRRCCDVCTGPDDWTRAFGSRAKAGRTQEVVEFLSLLQCRTKCYTTTMPDTKELVTYITNVEWQGALLMQGAVWPRHALPGWLVACLDMRFPFHQGGTP